MGFKEVLMKNLLTFTLILGSIVGITLGIIMRLIYPHNYSKRAIMYIGFPGELFAHMVKALAMPVTSSCIILSVGTLTPKLFKRLGVQFIIYIILTKLEAGILAAVLSMIFHPGVSIQYTMRNQSQQRVTEDPEVITTADTLLDMVRNMFPVNVIEVTMRHYRTLLKNTDNDTFDNIHKWKVMEEGKMVDSINLLGLVSVSVITGVTLNVMKEDGLYVLSLIQCFVKAILMITMWIMWFAPFGVTFLFAKEILTMDNPSQLFRKVGTFIGISFTALTIQIAIFYPLIYFIFVRKNPLRLLINFSDAITTALAAGTSYATIPISILCMRDKHLVDSRIVEFVMPVGAALNKDGSTMWLIMGFIFMTEVNHMSLNFLQLCTVVLICCADSCASVGSRHGTVMILTGLLAANQIPMEGIALLLAIDWLCGRYRTLVNICGDAVAACVLNQINQGLLEDIPEAVTPKPN